MLTKAQAIANHRTMWNWIAETTRKEKRLVDKYEAFYHFGWPYVDNMCWCCAYTGKCNRGNSCPISWPGGTCMSKNSPFSAWSCTFLREDYLRAAEAAEQIANLPENPGASLSKEETLYRHRVMWNWIAQTSIQEQRCVEKYEAFAHFGWGPVKCLCWCCEYDYSADGRHWCLQCPITHCLPYFGSWCKACNDNDYIAAARYAYQLAELPENPCILLFGAVLYSHNKTAHQTKHQGGKQNERHHLYHHC